MMSDWRLTRVDALFDAALALPADMRAAFLDAHCAADPVCRAEVEELLRLATAPSALLQPATLTPDLLRAALTHIEGHRRSDLAVDDRVGVWRVVREIGYGGMGTVYLVHRADGQSVQKGALKLVRGLGASDDIARRFRRERRILASLMHANIARLLDGGQTADGRPYLVMEYVEGSRIDQHCDARRLSVDERLALFLHVCAGIKHAHHNLVVHRDIKPANIIVAADGAVKLLDFGIARLLTPSDDDSEALTQPVVTILTPEYASPEQVRGQPVTISSDVYQLGLLLYELLTGVKAQTSSHSSRAALEEAICEHVPVRPSARVTKSPAIEVCGVSRATLVRTLAGDLDAIVLCALRKEPDRRYSSVDELAADVQRFRAGRPVLAQLDSVAYRTRKFVARHRAALFWIAAFLSITVATLPAVVSERLRTAREAARAEQVETLLANMFAFATPRASQPPTASLYVDHAAGLVRTELAAQPRSQARLLLVIGQVYNALGQYDASIRVLDQSLALRRMLFGENSYEVAQARHWRGLSEHYSGQYEGAEASFRGALGILRTAPGASGQDALNTMVELGDLLHTRGRLLEAEQILRDAVGPLRRSATPSGRGLPPGESLPRALMYLANVLRDRGVFDESAALFHGAIDAFRPFDGERNQQIAITQSYLARLHVMRGDVREAERLLAHALGVLRGTYGDAHPLVATTLREYGYLRIEQGRLAEAESMLDEAQRILQRLVGTAHSLVARNRAHQAELARRRGRTAAAVQLARDTLSDFERLGMPDHPAAIDARATLGHALLATGDRDAAARELRRALAGAEQQFVPADARIVRLRDAIAHAGAGAR
jgi:serine/threonine-protein kinase